MLRLDITYDFLPRESEILHLKFWELAFEQLKTTGVLLLRRAGQEQRLLGDDPARIRKKPPRRWKKVRQVLKSMKTPRSSSALYGTVTYVGKDIAYHLWKIRLAWP